MITMLNPNAIQNGSITQEMIDTSVLDAKQNITDESLATTSKEVVGAINELFNGGVKDKSIGIGKLTQAVQDTLEKVGTNVKVLSSGTDLKTVEEAGVYILSGLKDYLNFPTKWEHYNTSILIVSGDGNNYNKGKTIIGFQSGSQYPFAATLRNNEWIETDLYTVLTNIKKDVTTLQGLINTKVKIINEDTDLNTLTEDGLYLLSAGHSYTNYPLSDGASGVNVVLLNEPAFLIVSRWYSQTMASQIVLSVSNTMKFPLARGRAYQGSAWSSWNGDAMYNLWSDVEDSVKKRDDNLETTSKEVIGAINELFNGGVKDKSIEIGKLAQAVQNTLKMVGTNVKEVKTGEDLFSLEDGIYALNGTTYKNYPIGIPFDASAVCILVVTHSNQKVTLYGVDGSHSNPILPMVAIGDLTNKRWTGGSFYSFFASDYEVGHKLDQKLDNTSTLVDTEINNIWDNN